RERVEGHGQFGHVRQAGRAAAVSACGARERRWERTRNGKPRVIARRGNDTFVRAERTGLAVSRSLPPPLTHDLRPTDCGDRSSHSLIISWPSVALTLYYAQRHHQDRPDARGETQHAADAVFGIRPFG